MDDCILMVDNGFFKLVKRYFEEKDRKRYRLLQSFRNICENKKLNLKHLYFYWAPPFQSRVPTSDEKLKRKKYDLLKKMLDKKSWVTFREGRCQRIFSENGKPVFSQKGVDSWIVADMCLFKEDFPDISKNVLISSDSDFAPIIKLIKDRMKIEVILYTYFDKDRKGKFHRSNHLLSVVSIWKKLKEEYFEDAKI